MSRTHAAAFCAALSTAAVAGMAATVVLVGDGSCDVRGCSPTAAFAVAPADRSAPPAALLVPEPVSASVPADPAGPARPGPGCALPRSAATATTPPVTGAPPADRCTPAPPPAEAVGGMVTGRAPAAP
ncbi:MAG: hypothetical protein NTW05_12135 [Pseudonocardiales bacterium]|nr:hypothetical protein [Pseudonocardiales bacterium]